MATPPSIFDACSPRSDVLAGTTKDEQFAADLSQVLKVDAPVEYAVYRDATTFFRNSYPTRGLKALLKAACTRLSGAGGEIGSILRLDTQYGGGKTHALIALTHAVKGMQGVKDVAEFIDPSLLPRGIVRVAAIDGENSDPANGLTLEPGLKAFSLWGELAYQLAGAEGYRRIEESDRLRTAPGAETLRELFGGEPSLIMIDEVSVYLRKVEKVDPGAGEQFTAFLQALIKAVESSPRAALVFTLAVGKDAVAVDAYREEHDRALRALAEAEAVASRKATQLNPTEEDETADVLRRRLFDRVDPTAAEAALAAYSFVWSKAESSLPPSIITPELKDQFRRGYPLHPETLALLTEKTSSLSNFHRTRGMLRLLARTVHVLWKDRPADAFAIHPHHIDPGFGPIREEFTARLGQGGYTPALKSDVAAVAGDAPSIAQQIDATTNPGGSPVTSYVARTIFLNTMAHGDSARGIARDHLLYSVASPAIEPAFVEQARKRFVEESLYLDDHPGVPMRLMVEPNLRQMIRKQMDEIDGDLVRSDLNETIRDLFGRAGGKFQLIAFPAHPADIPDEVGDGRPFLVVSNSEALSISSGSSGIHPDLADYYRHKGNDRKLREFRNNLVFVVADARHVETMKDRVRRRLALLELSKPERLRTLAEHQQADIKMRAHKSRMEVAEAIFQAYRHLFYPSNNPMAGASEPIAHAVLEIPHASDKPGDGQLFLNRALRDHKKLLDMGDPPDSPPYVRDQTPLRTKGEITTQDLRNEFRRAPKLSILLSDDPLIVGIRKGIDAGVFLYREGDQLWGPGDPAPAIRIGENSFVHTMEDARKRKLWPRPEPLALRLSASPEKVAPGGSVALTASVDGGAEPFSYASDVPGLALVNTLQRSLVGSASPEETSTYRVEVTDARGQRQAASVHVTVDASAPLTPTGGPAPTVPPKTAAPPSSLSAEGPLGQALAELWEQARKARLKALDKIVVTFFEAPATWQAHQALAMMTGEVQTSCRFEAELSADGVPILKVEFEGRLDKANAVKGFLDPQLRSAAVVDFRATYTLTFAAGLPLSGDRAENFAKGLTRYGSGEAYVEAHAAADAQGVTP